MDPESIMKPLRFGPTGHDKSALGNASGGIALRTICPERAAQNSLVEPLQGS